MKRMLINKIGYEHLRAKTNCQDFGFINERVKCVADGCSEGKHSEVGAKLFCHLFEKSEDAKGAFEQLTSLFSDFQSVKDHMLFTVLFVTETDDAFQVCVAGDGYIIKVTHDDKIEYDLIDNENSPAYYAYNFVDKKYLKAYHDGVDFNVHSFPKSQYKNVGVSTDGLSYILKSEHKDEFEQHLLSGKQLRVAALINRVHNQELAADKEYGSFGDDITIAI